MRDNDTLDPSHTQGRVWKPQVYEVWKGSLAWGSHPEEGLKTVLMFKGLQHGRGAELIFLSFRGQKPN